RRARERRAEEAGAKPLAAPQGEVARRVRHPRDVRAVPAQVVERPGPQRTEARVDLGPHALEVRAKRFSLLSRAAGTRTMHRSHAHYLLGWPVRRKTCAERVSSAPERHAMATCPSCREHFSDDVTTCTKDGSTLVPDATFVATDSELKLGDQVGEYRI